MGVFSGVVKIRKGLMCKVMLDTSHIDELNRWFYSFTARVRGRIDRNDPDADGEERPEQTRECPAHRAACRLRVGGVFPRVPSEVVARGYWRGGRACTRDPGDGP